MESNHILIPSLSDESNTKTSLTFDSQPKFDSLLDKLRKGMSELTQKGDVFTKEMFKMYNTLEDIIISSKMNDNQNMDNMLTNSKPKPISSDDNTFSLSLKQSTIDCNDLCFTDFVDSKSVNNIEIQFNNNINNNNNNKEINRLNEEFLVSKQSEDNNEMTGKESLNVVNMKSYDLCSPLVSDCEQYCGEESVNTMTNKSKNKSIASKCHSKSNNSERHSKLKCLEELDKNNGYINVKTSKISEHIVNPLLDTINTLTSCSDSSDECDLNKKCYNKRERQRRLLNANRHLKRNTSNYYYSSSDGDSISGYTGSNSLESGYKSDFLGSNTPEIIDGSSLSSFGTAVDGIESNINSHSDSISHQISDLDSNNGKQSIVKPLNTNSTTKISFDINSSHNNSINKNQNQKYDDISSHTSAESIPSNSSTNRKTVGMFSEKIANRLKGFNNDSQLDHLLKLRKSLLKALKRCEEISSPANSRDGSPVISSRSSSPASTVVKSPLTSNSSNLCNTNSRRIREDSVSSDKSLKSKLSSSPLTARTDELCHCIEENPQNNCVASNNICSVNSTSNTTYNNCNNDNNSNNSKSVRFNSSVKISPLNSVEHNKQHINSNYAANYTVNKSILKDPLCETLRSAIKAGEFRSDCSLEGEIDTLLYGRTGGYYYCPQMEGSGHLDDSPSSTYVTMIEEKYRTFAPNAINAINTINGNASASKQSFANSSKKTSKDYSSLKTGFSSAVSAMSSVSTPHELDLITTSELRINATLSTTMSTTMNTTMSRPKANPYGIYGNTGNKSNRKSTKSHFSEMAKCMLEILDDLQVPQNTIIANQRQQNIRKDDTNHFKSALLVKKPETESIDLLMKELSRGQSDNSDISDISSISYRTLPEHHIYEEILYDCLEAQPQQCKYSHLHYSPRRTIASVSHSSVNNLRLDAPTHQSRSISPDFGVNHSNHSNHSNRHIGSWGRTSNRPKQRSNLYSLFADEIDRRNISKSLEREYCKRNTVDIPLNGSNNNLQTDNYGFKASL